MPRCRYLLALLPLLSWGQAKKPNFFGLAPAPDSASVERGTALFAKSCGFCHGTLAKGGNAGPDLVRSVLVLHDEGAGTLIGPVITEGRVDKGMPKFTMSPAEIKDIAAFLLSRSQATIVRGDYKYLNVVTGNAAAGKQYFDRQCKSCHSPEGDLAHIAGKFEPVALQARFIYPRTRTAKSQVRAVVTETGSTAVRGTLVAVDDFTIAIHDETGQYRSWTLGPKVKVELTDPLAGHEKLLDILTDPDMHNVLAYLVTLK